MLVKSYAVLFLYTINNDNCVFILKKNSVLLDVYMLLHKVTYRRSERITQFYYLDNKDKMYLLLIVLCLVFITYRDNGTSISSVYIAPDAFFSLNMFYFHFLIRGTDCWHGGSKWRSQRPEWSINNVQSSHQGGTLL